MVIDRSALMAILRREPEEQEFRNAIKLASSRLISASTRWICTDSADRDRFMATAARVRPPSCATAQT